MLSYILTLALLAPALVSAVATEGSRPCDGEPFVQQLRIADCLQTPCHAYQGSDAVMEVDFRSPVQSSTLRPVVFATALGATIEYTLPPAHQIACNDLISGNCPLSVDEDATYEFIFPITSIYPPIPVSVRLSLLNQNNQTVFSKNTDILVRLR